MQIFIAESNEDLRVGLQMILHRDAGLHVIGMAVQADGLLAQLAISSHGCHAGSNLTVKKMNSPAQRDGIH